MEFDTGKLRLELIKLDSTLNIAYNNNMAWKTIKIFGPRNLTGNTERLEALNQAKDLLNAVSVNPATRNEMIKHEQDHLFAFSDFKEGSGKKLKLVLEENVNKEIRLAVIPNRRQFRDEDRKAVGAVENPSEDDVDYGCFSRYRRR